MDTIILVVGLVVAGIALVVLLGLLLVRALRKASAGAGEQVRASFPDAVVGPELGMYRGGTGVFPRTRTTGWIVLTPQLLAVRPIVGTAISLPVADITGARTQKHFNSHWNGRPVLVLQTADGELGLTIDDPEAWQRALAR